MAGKQLDVESLDLLIKAVETYQEELATNRQILVNAANVCDAAMGSDDIAKKQIARLTDGLEKLKKTSQVASQVAQALRDDRKKAIDVFEN